jgi:nitrate/TMAO reductase-like tetraheme cytochrome c subunit
MADSGSGTQAIYQNPLSVLGAVTVTISAALFLTVFALDLFGLHVNPYIGIVFFLIIPGLFVAGLVLIPLGIWNERRRRARGKTREWARIDFANPRHRKIVAAVLILTLVNGLIVSLAAYRGIEYMDSTQFCGQVCHEVMEPEYVAYQDGPHSRVRCVQCHIGPGAPWFVRAKISGARQVLAVLFNTHSRPIPTPVHSLRPARDTCEQCHWPEKFHGDKLNVRREYADDEAVTESATTIQVHIGGGSDRTGTPTGIHWHVSAANQIEYVSVDGQREDIPYVRLTLASGEVREYFVEGVTSEKIAAGERRTMDCVDCHNRPTHPFAPSAERAVDAAIAAGEISRNLPFVRREVVSALKAEYASRAEALSQIASRLETFYRNSPADGPSIEPGELSRAITTAQRLYSRNVFPQMKVAWGTHPSNLGHLDAPGCFRCHDDNHKTRDGKVISQDCSLCHTIQ